MSNDIRDRLQDTARAVQAQLPPHTGFILLAFDFDPGCKLEYISNADRRDVVKVMREFIQRTEASGWGQHLDEGPRAPGQEAA